VVAIYGVRALTFTMTIDAGRVAAHLAAGRADAEADAEAA
jgi:hypothetical protein